MSDLDYSKVAEESHNVIMRSASTLDRENIDAASLYDIISLSNGWHAVKHEGESFALCEDMNAANQSVRMAKMKTKLMEKRNGKL